jgi:hypothetical protein
MNLDSEETEAIPLPDDFAERVLREVDRRRTRSRRVRGVGTGLALAAVMVVAGRLPGHVAREVARGLAHRQHPAASLALTADVASDDLLADDADLDPGSFFLASADGARPALDTGDDPDSDLLGQE